MLAGTYLSSSPSHSSVCEHLLIAKIIGPSSKPARSHQENGEEEKFFKTDFLRKKIKNFGSKLNNNMWKERNERDGGGSN